MKRVIKWHRYLGLVLGIFVVNLAITGMLLNHTDDLKLVDRAVVNPLLLRHYGIPTPRVLSAFRHDQHHLLDTTDGVYLDARPLPIAAPLVGLVAHEQLLLVANEQSLFLLSEEGELIDALQAPETIQRLGVSANLVVLETSTQALYTLNDDFTALLPLASSAGIRWSQREELQAAEQEKQLATLPRAGIPLERVIQDLHSGRIFGRAGQWLFDAVAILMITLVLSGLGLWLWRQLRLRQSRRRAKASARV